MEESEVAAEDVTEIRSAAELFVESAKALLLNRS